MAGPNGDPDISIDDDGTAEDEDDFSEGEYTSINSMLDQINNSLDDLEDRNDSLNGKLHELLESNRQARVEFRAQLAEPQTKDHLDDEEDSSSSSASQQEKDQDWEKPWLCARDVWRSVHAFSLDVQYLKYLKFILFHTFDKGTTDV